jgi:hypothetical protein
MMDSFKLGSSSGGPVIRPEKSGLQGGVPIYSMGLTHERSITPINFTFDNPLFSLRQTAKRRKKKEDGNSENDF